MGKYFINYRVYLGPIETECPVEKANIQVNQVIPDKIK
jgi:hypothetical protein